MTTPNDQQNILVTGATGFTGRFVVELLLRARDKHRVFVFARSQEKVRRLGFDRDGVSPHYGSFDEPDSFRRALEGKDVLVNVASLGFGHASSIIEACRTADLKHTVFVSTTSIYTKIDAPSKTVRLEGETQVQNSGLPWTIIRPTMIFGTPDDRNIFRLIRYVRRWPVLPVAGPGTYLLQPVYVGDVAWALRRIVEIRPLHKSYTISGKNPFSYNELVDTVASVMGKRILKIHVPLNVMVTALSVYEKLSRNPRLKVEQVKRLNEDKAYGHENATRDLGYDPTPFVDAIEEEMKMIVGSDLDCSSPSVR